MESNPELRAIYAAGQADRQGELPADLHERDAERLARVAALLQAGSLRTGEDCLHAAFVFQHGTRLEHYWQAHELAMQAVTLGHGPPARWLAAASYDRWLMHQGLPQKFGTQYRLAGSRWVLHNVDPATSDAERARWDIPPLAEAEARTARMNAQLDAQLRRATAERERPNAPAEADPPGVLAVLEQPGLRVALVGLSPQEALYMPEAMPTPDTLDPALVHPTPAELPARLTVAQLGDGYCAIEADGTLAVTWITVMLPAQQTMYVAWNLADGDAPALEALDFAGRPATLVEQAWSAVSRDRLPMIIVRAGPDTAWLVSGRLSPAELARIAASLPYG
jgi:hypothetical protein